MSYSGWKEAVREIAARTRAATDLQRRLAREVGRPLPVRLPRLVAAARLQAFLAKELDLVSSWPCTPGQLKYIKDLDRKFRHKPSDHREANAWTQYLWLKRNAAALTKLRLEAGDIVEAQGGLEVVSSIGGDGRVHFKGGSGGGAWPDKVKLRYRRDAAGRGSKSAKREAENRAALRGRNGRWSEAKRAELAPYSVSHGATEIEIERLRAVIDGAMDEAPIQAFLQEHPHVLAGLLGSDERFSISKPKLGAKYVPDFLLASVDSMGIGWLLVELETPKSSITMETANDLEMHARKGVSQIREWREWLLANVALARAPTRDEGLGLSDIRPQSRGLVLVGRRELLFENSSSVRQSFREQSNIDIHTYDWLLETLAANLRFVGPPASNPRYFDLAVPSDPDRSGSSFTGPRTTSFATTR